MIDVKELIARYSHAEHAARADAYFANLPDVAKLLRKPYFGIPETQANLHGMAEVLQLLRLFHGARVLDFGAGTGWFSRMLACLDCRPVAVDVSPVALGLGRRAFSRDPAAAGLSIDWRPYDGLRLPLDDGSVDRIVCYDSFHHVADQAATLREFHRVLAVGGRVAFHEPGPRHSRSADSQSEMRRHGVIENDVVVEEIWAAAQEMGFTGLELALTALRAANVGLDCYNRVIGGQADPADAAAILQGIVEAGAGLRIFAMTKGEPVEDSLQATGLGGSLAVEITGDDGTTLRGRAVAVNTGQAVWRASFDAPGAVRIGIRHWESTQNVDYGRVFLSASPVPPGQRIEVEFSLPAPPVRPAHLVFDLVAEFVCWFEAVGGSPVTIRLD